MGHMYIMGVLLPLTCVLVSDNNDHDGGSQGGRGRSRSPMSHRRRHLGDRVSYRSLLLVVIFITF